MAKILNCSDADDPRDCVHLAVQALVEGHIVAVPTDTGFNLAASAIRAGGADRLSEAIARMQNSGNIDLKPVSLGVRGVDEASDFSSGFSPVAHRIAKRIWPGPLRIATHLGPPSLEQNNLLLQALPDKVQAMVLDSIGRLSLECVGHALTMQIADLLQGPILFAEARDPTGRPIYDPDPELFDAALVLDTGKPAYRHQPTWIEVEGEKCTLLRTGVIDFTMLEDVSAFRILFVCTGNTCRSPMAEKLMQRKLSATLDSEGQSERAKSVIVQSAGLSAMSGGPASEGAIAAMQDRGLDLSEHNSCPVTENAIVYSDLILTMTHNHRQAILSRWPELSMKVHCLSNGSEDVADPFGGQIDHYQQCAKQIENHLDFWVEQVANQPLPVWNPLPVGDESTGKDSIGNKEEK